MCAELLLFKSWRKFIYTHINSCIKPVKWSTQYVLSFIWLGAIEKQKLVYILNRDAAARLTISSPLEAHKANTLVYHVVGVDVGFENPMFACLEMDYEVRTQSTNVQGCWISHTLNCCCVMSFHVSSLTVTGERFNFSDLSMTLIEKNSHVLFVYQNNHVCLMSTGSWQRPNRRSCCQHTTDAHLLRAGSRPEPCGPQVQRGIGRTWKFPHNWWAFE